MECLPLSGPAPRVDALDLSPDVDALDAEAAPVRAGRLDALPGGAS